MRRPLSKFTQWSIFGVYCTLILAAGAALVVAIRRESPPPCGVADIGSHPGSDQLQAGMRIYQANCARCHGETGMGDGPAANMLYPKPRSFASGLFKFGSTRSGLPTDEDLARTINKGLLPSIMPPWEGTLSPDQVRQVIGAIRQLAFEGHIAKQLQRQPSRPRQQAETIAHRMIDSGPVIAMPPAPATIDLERGRFLFLANCAACHDEDGRGRQRKDLRDNDDYPIAPRDLTAGPFKGGGEKTDLIIRIWRGIPGTPMPAFSEMSASDLWNVAGYVRSLRPSR